MNAPETTVYPAGTGELARPRKELAPMIHEAFQAFSRQVSVEGALDEKTKQLIAVAVAHVTQCPYGIRGHTKAAVRKGAHSILALDAAGDGSGAQHARR